MESAIVIALYRPQPGKGDALAALVARHEPALRAAGFVTGRPFVRARSSDGTVLEVFEWQSAEAARQAHEHPVVGALWGEMAGLAEFPPLADLAESTQRFPHFAPVA